MTAARISCPSCATTLRSSADPGTKIRCPSCKSIFKVEAPEEEDKPRRPAAVTADKPKRRSVRDEDEEEEDEDETENDDEEDERPARAKSGIKRGGSAAATKGKGKAASKHDDDEEDDEEEVEEEDRPTRKGGKKKKDKGSNKALLIGLLVGGVLLAGGGAFFFLNSGSKDEKKTTKNDTQSDNNNNAQAVTPQPVGQNTGGGLSTEVLGRAKKATVYVRVHAGDGKRASGTGFFGVAGRPTLVLTNAHVIGMKDKGSAPPIKVEVVINSGEKDEYTVPARVFKADGGVDLAVLEVAGAPPAPGWPPPLKIENAGGLQETQKLYVIGYPFGESLSKNVTVRESSVSSLHKDTFGAIEKLRVNGGMDPGNSGGPVIDSQGNVVGVSVAVILGTSNAFAIPGEKVKALLAGRISDRGLGDPYKKKGELVVRMSLQTVDPFQGIRDMKVDWWYGNEGKDRQGTTAEPGQEEGDSPRRTTTVEYQSRLGVGVVELPLQTMPEKGKVLWVQPHMVDGSQTQRWSDAVCVKLAPPTEDTPAMLQRVVNLGRTPLDLLTKEKYVYNTGGGDRSFTRQLKTRFWEDMRSATPKNSVAYFSVVPGSFAPSMKVQNQALDLPAPWLQMIKEVDKLGMVIEYDGQGMRARDFVDAGKVTARSRPLLLGMAKQLQAALEVMTVPLPNEEAQPGKSWEESKAMPIDFGDEDDADLADLRMIYTYRGMRTLPPEDGGRKQAVIDLVGSMKGSGKSSEVKGEARGDAVYDMKDQRFVKVKVNFEMISRIHVLGEAVKAEGIMDVELTRGSSVPLPDNLPSLETFAATPEQTGGLFETHRLEGTDEVTALAFAPDGHTLAVATRTSVMLWDPTTGRKMEPRIAVGMRGNVRSLAFAGNARLVVGGTNVEGTSISVFDLTSERGERRALLTGHTKPVSQVWITSDATVAVSASEDGSVRLWNAVSGDQLALIDCNVGPIKSMAVTSDGQFALVQGTATAALNLLQRRRLTPKDTNHNITRMTALDKVRFLCGGEDGSVRIVDARTGKELNAWKHHPGKVDWVSVRSDGKRALSTGAGGTLAVWDPTQTDAKVKPWTTKAPSSYGMTALSPSPAASYFACVRPQSGSVSLLKLEVPTK